MTARPVALGARLVGPGQPVLVIAEVGVNHDGDPDQADRLIEAAAVAGADAVKFQVFRADRLVTDDAPQAAYQAARAPARSQREMLARLELPDEEFAALAGSAASHGLLFLASPFDEESLEVVLACRAPAVKLGSGELTNLPLLEAVARSGRPLLLSTGMATLDEVGAALDAFRASGGREVVLFHCLSAYPAPIDQSNLRAIVSLAEAFAVPIGYSDHTLGSTCAVAAVALGACAVEKHLTLDRTLPGPDHRASADPVDMVRYVAEVRSAEACLGDGVKRAMPCETEIRGLVRKSLVARVDLAPGATIGPDDLIALRPGSGIPPAAAAEVVGRRVRAAVRAGRVLTWEMLE